METNYCIAAFLYGVVHAQELLHVVHVLQWVHAQGAVAVLYAQELL